MNDRYKWSRPFYESESETRWFLGLTRWGILGVATIATAKQHNQ